jgi:hypothetical protein
MPFITRAKSPVLNDPAPAKVFEELVGARIMESPKCTIQLGPTLSILTFPIIAGIVPLLAYGYSPLLYDGIRLEVRSIISECHIVTEAHILW